MNRREMIKEYKNSLRPMGIVQVKNLRNGRVYLMPSANTAGTINSIRFQLNMGAFPPSASLTKDWKERESRASSLRSSTSSSLSMIRLTTMEMI